MYFSDSSGESSRFCEIGALHDVMLYLEAVWMRGAYADSLRFMGNVSVKDVASD